MAKKKGKHLRAEDLYAIVVWLEHPRNFTRCFGVDKKTSVGKQSSKTAGFKAMAEMLATSSKGEFRLDTKQMRARFATYKDRYLRTKKYEDSTGAGVTPEDEENGIFTLPQKLEAMCPRYEKMGGLFAAKANVIPMDVFDSTEEATNTVSFVEEAVNINEDNREAAASFSEDIDSDEGIESIVEDENNTPGTPQSSNCHAATDLAPRSPSLSFSYSDPSDVEEFTSIPLTQPTPASATPATAPASPTPQDPQQTRRTEPRARSTALVPREETSSDDHLQTTTRPSKRHACRSQRR